jgi:glycosyltransferase involved in cell wall biosynthesis
VIGISVSRGERRVLVLVENLSVPFDRRVWQECATLSRAGYRVSVVCPAGRGRDEASYERVDDVAIYRYPLREARGLLGYAREYGTAAAHTHRLARELGKGQPFSVVHACNPPDFLLATVLSHRRRGAAFVFDHHDLVPELYLSRFGRGRDIGFRAALALERFAFRTADVVLATNESYKRVAIERGGVDPENVFVVRSAPDTAQFSAVPSDPQLRRDAKYLLVYLGVMGPQDGVDHALHALALLASKRTDWRAAFIGSGDTAPAMEALRDELKLGDMVEFTGRVPNDVLLAWLSSADVGLSPDPLNPLNDMSTMNKVLEYMAVGLPVVTYDLTETRVSCGGAAAYVRPNDPAAFADSVHALLDDPARRVQMSELGLARVRGELSWDHSELNLLAAYDRALKLRAGQRRHGDHSDEEAGVTVP